MAAMRCTQRLQASRSTCPHLPQGAACGDTPPLVPSPSMWGAPDMLPPTKMQWDFENFSTKPSVFLGAPGAPRNRSRAFRDTKACATATRVQRTRPRPQQAKIWAKNSRRSAQGFLTNKQCDHTTSHPKWRHPACTHADPPPGAGCVQYPLAGCQPRWGVAGASSHLWGQLPTHKLNLAQCKCTVHACKQQAACLLGHTQKQRHKRQ